MLSKTCFDNGIGKNDCCCCCFCQGHCFGGGGYFGVGSPQFFYADMEALTLGKIIRLLGFTFPLPPPIAESGFPKGAAVSVVTRG